MTKRKRVMEFIVKFVLPVLVSLTTGSLFYGVVVAYLHYLVDCITDELPRIANSLERMQVDTNNMAISTPHRPKFVIKDGK